MKNHKVISSLKKDGDFSSTIAKSSIITIYSLWDELYRKKIANELSPKSQNFLCDLMGEIWIIINCIVHNKSQITSEMDKIKFLNWELKKGEMKIKYNASLFKRIN